MPGPPSPAPDSEDLVVGTTELAVRLRVLVSQIRAENQSTAAPNADLSAALDQLRQTIGATGNQVVSHVSDTTTVPVVQGTVVAPAFANQSTAATGSDDQAPAAMVQPMGFIPFTSSNESNQGTAASPEDTGPNRQSNG